MLSFLEIRFVDILDIALTAYLMFASYKIIKGTIAGKILLSVLAFLVFGIIVRALNMSMLSAIMGSFVNIGLIALLIIFQPEIRQFLILVSTKYSFMKRVGLDKVLSPSQPVETDFAYVEPLVNACKSMSEAKTGALIVIPRNSTLDEFTSTGDVIDASISQQLIESLFFKNSPLHDGAIVIDKRRIIAAGCILPVSKNMSIPKSFGLRHRAALGVSEVTDAIAIVVSEETGHISVFDNGEFSSMMTPEDLTSFLEKL